MTKTKYKIVIPARYASSRFPGKPLVDIAGRAMIAHTWQCALAAGATENVVATDDSRIFDYCSRANISVVMTSADHDTGTDRVAEVVDLRQWDDEDIVVCLQGDEPATPPSLIQQVARNLDDHKIASIATLCAEIHDSRVYLNPNRVKVVFNKQGYAMYFSRAPIPHRRDNPGRDNPGRDNLGCDNPGCDSPERENLGCDNLGPDEYKEDSFPRAWVHIGMYAYRVKFLREFKNLQTHELETEEKLEQLRALANGYRIHVDTAVDIPGHGVDHPDDVAVLQKILEKAKPEQANNG